MNATEIRLRYEMEDARRDLDWADRELNSSPSEAFATFLHTVKQQKYQQYYRAKSQLKQLNQKEK